MENLLLDSAELEQNPLKKLAKEILEAFEIREKACADENWDEEHTQMVEIKDHAVDLAGMILDVQPSQAKYIESVTTDKVELEIYECSCGFHLGIDATYIDQVDDCSFVCPSCGETISTEENDNDSGGKMKFSTIEDGVKTIHEACDKAEISEGEFADYLILNYDECFDSSIEPVVAIQAIQKFRQWDYEMEDDAIECFGGTEALSEYGFYGFIFMRNGQSMQLPDGVRVGIQTEDGGIVLDEGITACFKSTVEELNVIDSVLLNSMTLEQFEKIDGNFTFYTRIIPKIGRGSHDKLGTIHCVVEDAYELFFRTKQDAYNYLVLNDRSVPCAYVEYNNGYGQKTTNAFEEENKIIDCGNL